MPGNYTPGVATRKYVRQAAAHSPYDIGIMLRYNVEAGQFQTRASLLHNSPPDGDVIDLPVSGDQQSLKLLERLRAGFPSHLMVLIEREGAEDFRVPFSLHAIRMDEARKRVGAMYMAPENYQNTLWDSKPNFSVFVNEGGRLGRIERFSPGINS